MFNIKLELFQTYNIENLYKTQKPIWKTLGLNLRVKLLNLASY